MENLDSRIALVGIIVNDISVSEQINKILHDYSEYIIGRMGLPHKKNNVSIISVVVDAPQDKISALSGKLGNINGVSSKTIYAKV